ncbi:MAG TPA: lipoate--protein ligase family protein [Nitrospirota bacterium]|nr:lipoate--protein ligase family protein [Nitrospirota bacterium]
MTTWRYIDDGPNIGVYNMAIDEELLARAQAGEAMPVLRFYGWRPPAVSLGRFQKTEVAVNKEVCKERGIDIVRRITGGRAVLHDCELTYSIISRTDDPLFPHDVHGTYKVIAAGLLAGFKNLGIHAETVSRSSRFAALVKKDMRNPSCFSSPAWYEIIVNGKKIVGSAQRRVTGAFLQHGSILMKYDPDLEGVVIPGGGAAEAVTCIVQELRRDVTFEEVKQAFKQGFAEALGIAFA